MRLCELIELMQRFSVHALQGDRIEQRGHLGRNERFRCKSGAHHVAFIIEDIVAELLCQLSFGVREGEYLVTDFIGFDRRNTLAAQKSSKVDFPDPIPPVYEDTFLP